jgi:hypothetical protein
MKISMYFAKYSKIIFLNILLNYCVPEIDGSEFCIMLQK